MDGEVGKMCAHCMRRHGQSSMLCVQLRAVIDKRGGVVAMGLDLELEGA